MNDVLGFLFQKRSWKTAAARGRRRNPEVRRTFVLEPARAPMKRTTSTWTVERIAAAADQGPW